MQRQSMRPDSIASKCLAVLDEGPATTGEIAAELGLKSALAAAHMQLLKSRQKVRCKPHSIVVGFGLRTVWLWEAA